MTDVTEENPLAVSAAYLTRVDMTTQDPWKLYSKGDDLLGEFPATWRPEDCALALDLAKKYELIAFNRGVRMGEAKAHKQDDAKLEHMKKQVLELAALNERLGDALDRHINKI